MSKVDQFESIFKSAIKEVFAYEPTKVRTVLVVCDLEPEEAEQFGSTVRGFLSVLGEDCVFEHVSAGDLSNVKELVDLVEDRSPDLVCTYRCLKSTAWRWPYSLGVYLDVLTQVTQAPILVMPHPRKDRAAAYAQKDTDNVMILTDHLTGDRRLINYGIALTEKRGTLYLAHVESKVIFERYMEIIAKLPSIDTDTARLEIHNQLLKEPAEYIESCIAEVLRHGLPLTMKNVVMVGQRLAEYHRLIEEHQIDLLIMNTKDEDQLAMHGIAHPLAVELRHVPVLML